MPTATIIVQVKSFVPVGQGLCQIEPLTLTDNANGRVRIDPANPFKLIVKARGNPRIEMRFVIEPAAQFDAAGAAFDRDGLNQSGGNHNFSLGSISDNVLTIVNHAKRATGTWELYIPILKRGATTELGIIDPGVENSDEQSLA